MVLTELDRYSHCFSLVNWGFARHRTQKCGIYNDIGLDLLFINSGAWMGG